MYTYHNLILIDSFGSVNKFAIRLDHCNHSFHLSLLFVISFFVFYYYFVIMII